MSILPKAIYRCNPYQVVNPYQCNPYQDTNGIFQRTRTNNFTICMEIQKSSNSQSNPEKEEWNWRNQHVVGSTTKPQSSRQYVTGTKTEI